MELSKKDIDFLVSIMKKYIDTSLATITNKGRLKVHHFEEQYMRTVNGGLPLDQSLFRTYLQTCGKVNVWIDSDKTGELPTDGDQDVLYFLWVDGSYVMYIYTDTYVLITTTTQIDDLTNNYSMPSLSLLLKKRTKRSDGAGDYEYYNPNIVEAPNDLSDTLNYVNDCIYFNVNGDDNILKNLDKYYINIMRFNKNGHKRSWKILDDRATSPNDLALYDYFKDYLVYSVPLSDCEMTNISLTTGGPSTKGSIQFKYPYRVSHLLNRIFYISDNGAYSIPRRNMMELMNLGTYNDSNPNGLFVYNPGAKIGSGSLRGVNFYNITPKVSSLSYPVQFVLTYGHPAPKTSSENPSGQRQIPRSNTVPGKLMANPIKYSSFMELSDPNYDLLKDEVTVNLTLKLNNK